MSTISQIHTSCKNCIFSIYENITQINCALNYIEKFKNKNIEILEAYDEEKEFYVINNKKCIGYRGKDWLEKNNLNNIDAAITKFNESNKIHYLAIIDTKNIDFDTLYKIIKDISNQKLIPQRLYIIRYPDNDLFGIDKLQPVLDESKIPWKIHTAISDDIPLEYFITTIINVHKTRFAMIVNNYSNDIISILNKANNIVCENMESLMLLKNTDSSCYIFSTSVYKLLKVQGQNLLTDQIHHSIL